MSGMDVDREVLELSSNSCFSQTENLIELKLGVLLLFLLGYFKNMTAFSQMSFSNIPCLLCFLSDPHKP